MPQGVEHVLRAITARAAQTLDAAGVEQEVQGRYDHGPVDCPNLSPQGVEHTCGKGER